MVLAEFRPLGRNDIKLRRKQRPAGGGVSHTKQQKPRHSNVLPCFPWDRTQTNRMHLGDDAEFHFLAVVLSAWRRWRKRLTPIVVFLSRQVISYDGHRGKLVIGFRFSACFHSWGRTLRGARWLVVAVGRVTTTTSTMTRTRTTTRNATLKMPEQQQRQYELLRSRRQRSRCL